MSGGYKFAWNKHKIASIKGNVVEKTLDLAYAIGNQAMRGAPIDTGALVNSIRVTDDQKNTIYVVAGGSFSGKSVPYAKRREFENNLHPNKRFYMKSAFAWGNENYKRYYKGVTK